MKKKNWKKSNDENWNEKKNVFWICSFIRLQDKDLAVRWSKGSFGFDFIWNIFLWLKAVEWNIAEGLCLFVVLCINFIH